MTQIEERKKIIVGGILLIAFGSLIVTSMHGLVGYDPFWHLQMGRDWIENGLSPWVDHYSFTYNGHAITNPPVIFQVLLYLATSKFGLAAGFQVIRFGCFLLTLSASFLLLRQIKAPAFIYALIIPMIVLLLEMRPLVRPELISYTLSIVALMLYFRAKNSISARNLIPMVALMWFWSIYHSSIIGYVIFFGYFLDCAVAQINTRAPATAWAKWLMWGLLLIAVGFLNPSFSHPLVEVITFPSEWKILIMEYLPSGTRFKSIAGIYVLIFFAVLTPMLAVKERKFGMLVVSLVLIYSAIMLGRMVTPSGIVVVMMAAYLLTVGEYSHRLNMLSNKFLRLGGWCIVLVLVGVTLYSNVEIARYLVKDNKPLVRRYPTATADYMIKYQVSGRIFNNYGMGGYLIYRLAPQNQVYIDGRTQILYPLEHMERYLEISKTNDSEVLRAELDKYSIDQIIWEYSQARHDLVQEVGSFGLDFLDARSVLYTRGTSNFTLFGKLLSSPECWRSDMLEKLDFERQRMDEILPKYSALFPFANLVVGYSHADDGKAFFDENIDGDKWFDEMRRFAAYRFLETGEYHLVANLLGGVEFLKPKDYLASALAKLKAGDLGLASQIVEEYSSVKWTKVKPEEDFIHYKLYQLLEMQRDLTSTEQKITKILRVKLEKLGISNLDPDYVLDVGSFCTSSGNQPETVHAQ